MLVRGEAVAPCCDCSCPRFAQHGDSLFGEALKDTRSLSHRNAPLKQFPAA